MKEPLDRFLVAQDHLYERAIEEIREGNLSMECWIRYVFPQLKRSGTSELTNFYGLDNREEAKAYIEHPILRERLIKAFQVLLDSDKPIYEVFSPLGVMKVRTCAKLFKSLSEEPIFKAVIVKYHWD